MEERPDMIGVLKTVADLMIGLAIAGVVLAVLLPLLTDAGYFTVGSQEGLWIIGLVIGTCIALTVFRPSRSSLDSEPTCDD